MKTNYKLTCLLALLLWISPSLWAQDSEVVEDQPARDDDIAAEIDEMVEEWGDGASESAVENTTEPDETTDNTIVVIEVQAGTEESKSGDHSTSEKRYRQSLIQIGANNTLLENEVADEMITVMGNSSSAGYVNGEMVTVLGSSKLNGHVNGEYVVVLGTAELGPNAVVEGEVVVIGGDLKIDPMAQIYGETINIPFIPQALINHFNHIPVFIKENVFLFRPISLDVSMTWTLAGVFLALYWILAALFPRQIEKTTTALEEKPGNSFLAGALVLVMFGPFSLILVSIVIGIPLVPLMLIFLMLATCFGKASVFNFLGRRIGKSFSSESKMPQLMAILIGGILIYLFYLIPFLGGMLWMGLTVLGLGAACVALGDGYSRKRAASLEIARQARISAGSLEGEEGEIPADYAPEAGTPLSQIDTAQSVHFPRVGFWWRFLATVIDFIIVGAVTGILTGGNGGSPIIPFVYYILMWGWKGSTLGGMALGIRVQKLNGEKLDWSTAIIRSLSTLVSIIPVFLGFFWVAWDPDKQSWHDKIAGTTVVQVPRGYTWN